MTGEVIKQFMVGLGFEIKDGELSKFMDALKSTAVRVTAVSAAIAASAAGIFATVAKASSEFEKLGYEYRLIAPAINQYVIMRNEMMKAYRAAGINLREAITYAVKFNVSLEKTQIAFKALYMGAASKFFPQMTKTMDKFRQSLYANMPKINAIIVKVVSFLLKVFENLVQLGTRVFSVLGRVYEFFSYLDKATGGFSTAIIAVIAAWRLLNLSFLMSPIGLILLGFLAVLALIDDFMTFDEGGDSLLNWGPVIPIIKALKEAFTAFMEVAKQLVDTVWPKIKAMIDVMAPYIKDILGGAFEAVVIIIENLFQTMTKIFGAVGSLLKGNVKEALGSFAGAIATGVGDTASGLFDTAKNTGGKVVGRMLGWGDGDTQAAGKDGKGSPLGADGAKGAGASNSINQNTVININGSKDPHATANAVAGKQSRVNYDMTRNMKGYSK